MGQDLLDELDVLQGLERVARLGGGQARDRGVVSGGGRARGERGAAGGAGGEERGRKGRRKGEEKRGVAFLFSREGASRELIDRGTLCKAKVMFYPHRPPVGQCVAAGQSPGAESDHKRLADLFSLFFLPPSSSLRLSQCIPGTASDRQGRRATGGEGERHGKKAAGCRDDGDEKKRCQK